VNACVRAQDQGSPIQPGRLHVAIIGAGATGTELAAELHHTARAIIQYGLDKIVPERDQEAKHSVESITAPIAGIAV
jgi:NADH:ubiquinone reductase (H+-translocating)